MSQHARDRIGARKGLHNEGWDRQGISPNGGSFSTLWVGILLYMQGPDFGWRSDGVGGLALIGSAAAVAAPSVGGCADRRGPRFSLLAALSVLVASRGILAGIVTLTSGGGGSARRRECETHAV